MLACSQSAHVLAFALPTGQRGTLPAGLQLAVLRLVAGELLDVIRLPAAQLLEVLRRPAGPVLGQLLDVLEVLWQDDG